MKRLVSASAAFAALLAASGARAGSFDGEGALRLDPTAVATIGFETEPERYLPPDADPVCADPMFTLVASDAIEGATRAELRVSDRCAERFSFALPAEQASYRASLWMRHGALDAAIVILYQDGSGLDWFSAQMTPTGRTTSDGWVEVATNDFPVDGAQLKLAYLKLVPYAATDQVDVDALEVVRSGEYEPQGDCAGLGDPACGPDSVCMYGRCILGRVSVPVLPADAQKGQVVDVLESQLRVFYGGQRSRALYLPKALAELEQARGEKTAWGFWSHWFSAIHALHDWHTDTNMSMTGSVGPKSRLNACFIEGDADLTHGAFPKDPLYPDILVSHVGPDSGGLAPGDRLLAIDGQHPIAWAASLWNVDWGFHIATDPSIFADYAEALGGPPYQGLIVKFAHDITVLRCQPEGPCASVPETLLVSSLTSQSGGNDVACDNRPSYHLDAAKVPDPTTHHIWGRIYTGTITGTTPEEAIYGMVWDTLMGNGSQTSPVNKALLAAVDLFKQNARGVILDHRAGNGGTLDAAENVTRLVRAPDTVAAMRSPMEVASYGGPETTAEGLAIFEQGKGATGYDVGDAAWAAGLPVALIIHRDGSASDYMPYGMKGAPNTRIFGPHPTVGAFSTYVELSSWGGLYYQFGSGDTIAKDGTMLIGHGVAPDVVILPRQSDLVAGKDTLFEEALAWVRKELKP